MKIVVQSRVPSKEIRAEVPDAIRKVQMWFELNSRRKTCNAQIWQGRVAKVRRSHVAVDIKAAAFDLIRDNEAAGVK